MVVESSVLYQALKEAGTDLTSSEKPNQLTIFVNGEQIITHTPITSGFAQKIADEVARVQNIEKDGVYFSGNIEIYIDISLLLEMIHNAQRVEELLGKAVITVSENDIFYLDHDWGTVTYGELWKIVSSESGTQNFVSHIIAKDENEQIKLLQHIHKFKIPEGRISLKQDHEFEWRKTNGDSVGSSDFIDRLNGPLLKDNTELVSISWLFENIKNKKYRENIVRYCLYCFSAGIQLKP